MAKVILIVPKGVRYPLYPHLGLLYLAAMIHQDYSVKIIDCSVEPDPDKLLKMHLTSDTLCVGITSMTGAQIGGGLKIASLVRGMRPDLPLVWGGIHATLDPRGTLSHPLVDIVCQGEGELSFPLVIKSLAEKKSLDEIPGIGYKHNGKSAFTEPGKEFFDLNQLPLLPFSLVNLPAYDRINFLKLFNPPTHYVFGFKNKSVGGLETTRGCPYQCTYCVRSIKREPIHFMEVGMVMRHIEHMRSHNIRSIEFVNDNFFCNLDWARNLLQEIKEQNWRMEFFLNVRADFLAKVDKSILDLMESAGVLTIGVGAESGSDRMLGIINKQAASGDALIANRRIKKHRIMALFGFLGGFPDERLDDIIKTYLSMFMIMLKNPRSKVMFSKLFPNVNTPVYQRCLEKGLPPRARLDEWVDALDLSWRGKKTVYIEPEVEEWVLSTQYFRDLITIIWILRSPYDSFKRRLMRFFAVGLFWLCALPVIIRARFRLTGPGPDTLLGEAFRKLGRVMKINKGYNF